MSDSDMRSAEPHIRGETEQHMPRRVSLTVKGGLLIFAVSAISIAFVVLTAFLYLRNAREIRDGDDLVRLGQMTYAYDLQVGGLRGWSVSYKLRYNGKEYSGRAPIPKSNENEMFGYTTAPFPVLYLPENPSVNHPKNWKEPDSHPWHVYGFFLVIPLLLCLSRGPDVLLDFQLARAGIAVVGTAIGGTYTKSGTLKLKYEFRDSDDLLNDGSGYYPVTPKKGAEVVVLYLPQDTAQNRPYPLFYFRAAALEPRVVPLSNK